MIVQPNEDPDERATPPVDPPKTTDHPTAPTTRDELPRRYRPTLRTKLLDAVDRWRNRDQPPPASPYEDDAPAPGATPETVASPAAAATKPGAEDSVGPVADADGWGRGRAAGSRSAPGWPPAGSGRGSPRRT